VDFSRAISNLNSSQLQHGVIVQAEKFMNAYGARGHEDARRRRFQAGSAAVARCWLRVKAEIGRRLFERRDDTADFDRDETKPSEPASVERFAPGSRDSQPTDPVLFVFPSLAGLARANCSPAPDDRTEQVPGERGRVRRQAEADMRAAMKAGDLDGLGNALRRLAPLS
jgi:hypothetical protein